MSFVLADYSTLSIRRYAHAQYVFCNMLRSGPMALLLGDQPAWNVSVAWIFGVINVRPQRWLAPVFLPPARSRRKRRSSCVD